MNSKVLVVLSGGMDSTVLAYQLAGEGKLSAAVSFDYGQKHRKELIFAGATAKELGIPHSVIDLRSIALNSALTNSDGVIPDGHYAADTMSQTVVPARNLIMLSIAAGMASSNNLSAIATAVHAGDHFIYPDCRPNFMDALRKTLHVSLEGDARVELLTPFITFTKRKIAQVGSFLNVDWSHTWSCYKGGGVHCGLCGTCVERLEALDGIADSTEYVDKTYWRSVCKT